MATITVTEKINKSGEPIQTGRQYRIDIAKIEANKQTTNTIGFRTTTSKTYVAQKGHGGFSGSNDLFELSENPQELLINTNLFDRLEIFARKNEAIV